MMAKACYDPNAAREMQVVYLLVEATHLTHSQVATNAENRQDWWQHSQISQHTSIRKTMKHSFNETCLLRIESMGTGHNGYRSGKLIASGVTGSIN